MEFETLAQWTEDGREWRVRVAQDIHRDNGSRDWDNLGVMACWHRRYRLGDVQPEEAPQDYRDALPEGTVVLPLYLYEHSGITISTDPFSCPWDSGQVGFIYATPERIKEIGTPADRVEECLRAEVETYDKDLRGDVWGFVVQSRPAAACSECERENEWTDKDSCWGFYGTDWFENGMADHWDSNVAARVKSALAA